MLLNCGVGETLESPLDCEEIQPVHPKGNQSWMFIGRTDAEAETPILWPPDSKNWLIWKDPDAGKDWRWEEKGMTEDEMVRWHHWCNGHEFEYTPGVGVGLHQESWHAAVHGVTKCQTQLNDWTELNLWWERQCYKTAKPLTPYSVTGKYLCYNSKWMLYFHTW